MDRMQKRITGSLIDWINFLVHETAVQCVLYKKVCRLNLFLYAIVND